MAEQVKCARCGETREGLGYAPFPNEMGQRIGSEICAVCWKEWLQRQNMIINHYGLASMCELGGYDWRFSEKNVWKVERHLQVIPHTRLRSSESRYKRLLARYEEWHAQNPGRSPDYFDDRHTWML